MLNLQQSHGDVLLYKIDKIPEGVKDKKHKKGIVLAEGEVTGHYHIVTPKREKQTYTAEEIGLFEKDGILYLKTTIPTKITHEEHKPQTIDPGIYQIGIVQEYDHLEQEKRNVVD